MCMVTKETEGIGEGSSAGLGFPCCSSEAVGHWVTGVASKLRV